MILFDLQDKVAGGVILFDTICIYLHLFASICIYLHLFASDMYYMMHLFTSIRNSAAGPAGGPTSFGLAGPVAESLHHGLQTGKFKEQSLCLQQQERPNAFCDIL